MARQVRGVARIQVYCKPMVVRLTLPCLAAPSQLVHLRFLSDHFAVKLEFPTCVGWTVLAAWVRSECSAAQHRSVANCEVASVVLSSSIQTMLAGMPWRTQVQQMLMSTALQTAHLGSS